MVLLFAPSVLHIGIFHLFIFALEAVMCLCFHFVLMKKCWLTGFCGPAGFKQKVVLLTAVWGSGGTLNEVLREWALGREFKIR